MSRSNQTLNTLGDYVLLEKLGSGSFASVYRCEHTITHQKFAGKLYDLDFAISDLGYRMVRKEVSILKLLRSSKVIRFQEAVYTKQGVLIVMELVEGRTLLDVMPSAGGVPESFAKPIFRQILEALFFLHCNGIVHRDLKLENVMIQRDGEIKLIDFGLADYVPKSARRPGLLIKNRCGSPHYYAPEMIIADNHERFQGGKVDIWAAGVLLYSMISGFHPFYSEHDKDEELFEQIIKVEITYDSDFSKELKDLLRRIFIKDPNIRASLREIQNHPWTNNTSLAGSADRWIQRGDTTCSSSSPSRLIDALSVEDHGQAMGSQDLDSFPKVSDEKSGDTVAMKKAFSIPRNRSSTVAVDGEQAHSDAEQEMRHTEPFAEPRNTQEYGTREAAARTYSSERSGKALFKFSLRGMMDCFKGLFGWKDSSDSSEGQQSVETEYENITVTTNDENRRPSTPDIAGSSRGTLHGFDSESSWNEQKEHARCSGPFWKVSFLCWGNF